MQSAGGWMAGIVSGLTRSAERQTVPKWSTYVGIHTCVAASCPCDAGPTSAGGAARDPLIFGFSPLERRPDPCISVSNHLKFSTPSTTTQRHACHTANVTPPLKCQTRFNIVAPNIILSLGSLSSVFLIAPSNLSCRSPSKAVVIRATSHHVDAARVSGCTWAQP